MHHRLAKDLTDDHPRHVLQHSFIFLCEAFDFCQAMTELSFPDFLGFIGEGHHDRTGGEIGETILDGFDFLLDDPLRSLGFPFAETDIALYDVLQIVDVV